MQEAGAAAIELNTYYLPGDRRMAGGNVEQRHLDVLTRVKQAVTILVAVKLSPYVSPIGEIATRLDQAGADGLVLFNRFCSPTSTTGRSAARKSRRPPTGGCRGHGLRCCMVAFGLRWRRPQGWKLQATSPATSLLERMW